MRRSTKTDTDTTLYTKKRFKKNEEKERLEGRCTSLSAWLECLIVANIISRWEFTNCLWWLLTHQHTKALVQESLGTHSSTLHTHTHTHTHIHIHTYKNSLTYTHTHTHTHTHTYIHIHTYTNSLTYTHTHTQTHTVTHSHTSPQVLWPYLLEFLVPVEYTRSLSIVCRCVSHIAEKKREQRDEDYLINFVEYGERRNERAAVHYWVYSFLTPVNLPKPQAIIARLLVRNLLLLLFWYCIGPVAGIARQPSVYRQQSRVCSPLSQVTLSSPSRRPVRSLGCCHT